MKKQRSKHKSLTFLGGAAAVFTALLFIGAMPELVRYLRIRRM